MDKRRTSMDPQEPSRQLEPAGSGSAVEDEVTAANESGDATVEESGEGAEEGSDVAAEEVARVERDLLDDLRRLQAEFDNYRKRVMREQAAMVSRASARLIERLLPVLDNFERALEHGEGGPGLELVQRELRDVLGQEGLAEITAEGEPFDPRVHEAFAAEDEPDVAEPVVKTVYRRGYKLGDKVLRPAMVVVARPPEKRASSDGSEAAPSESED